MLRYVTASFDSRLPMTGPGALSIVVHGLFIAGAVIATLPPSELPSEGLSNRVVYMPPPDRPPSASGPRESIHFLTLSPGTGLGPGPSGKDLSRGVKFPEQSALAGESTPDSATAVPPAPPATGDSVYTQLEVDSAVVRSNDSAAPIYPPELIEKHVEGTVVVRFVVDTTGLPDLESLTLVRVTDDRFVKPLTDALPHMRFSPAKIGPHRVRQLVEQSFTFKITQVPIPRPAAVPDHDA